MIKRAVAAFAAVVLTAGVAWASLTGGPRITLAMVWSAITGDCAASNGSLTCLSTNGTAFGALATVTPGANVATLLAGAASGTGGPVGTTSPSLTTPTLGAATATSINKVTVTAPATAATLTIANNKTLTVNNSIALSGTDSTTMTLPNASSNIPAYASGSWTPTITASGTAGTPAYTFNVGSYETVGTPGTRLSVTVRFSILLSGWTGTPSGSVSINGLPIAASSASNDFGDCQVVFATVSSGGTAITGLISAGTSAISLFTSATAGGSSLTAAQTGTTPELIGFCTYHT